LMKDFDSWLHNLSNEPLPGGVAAAAVASALGAALVAKATRVTLQRQDLAHGDRIGLQAVHDLAVRLQAVLLRLAEADEQAYRAVLEARGLRSEAAAQREAWREATESPIRVAEACRWLLGKLAPVVELCWPAVEPDLAIGAELLQTGMQATLSVADHNLQGLDNAAFELLRSRVEALKQA
jgi:formiminotetrahydrofolate cyclodeaminase